MAFTTWNPSDKNSYMSLSGGNLIATAGVVASYVRGIDAKAWGKYYIEYTSTSSQNTSNKFGFARADSPFTGVPSGTACFVETGSAAYYPWPSGSQVGGPSIGSITGSEVLCLAIDLTNQLLWGRIGAAGNWNGNATYNPATGVGGFSFAAASLGHGVNSYPFLTMTLSGNSITANFGASGFTGAVPSGFTSGWDDSGPGPPPSVGGPMVSIIM